MPKDQPKLTPIPCGLCKGEKTLVMDKKNTIPCYSCRGSGISPVPTSMNNKPVVPGALIFVPARPYEGVKNSKNEPVLRPASKGRVVHLSESKGRIIVNYLEINLPIAKLKKTKSKHISEFGAYRSTLPNLCKVI